MVVQWRPPTSRRDCRGRVLSVRFYPLVAVAVAGPVIPDQRRAAVVGVAVDDRGSGVITPAPTAAATKAAALAAAATTAAAAVAATTTAVAAATLRVGHPGHRGQDEHGG